MDKIAVAQTTSSGNWRENIEKAQIYKESNRRRGSYDHFSRIFHELLSGY